MSITLFKTNIKRNLLLFLIFVGVGIMYICVEISMFDPTGAVELGKMLDAMPKALVSAFGMSGIGDTLTSFLAGYYYGFFVFIIPMVYSIILCNRLVAKMTDNGSLAYLLATPNSRTKIIVTQGIYLLISIAVLFVVIFGVGVVTSEMLFKGLLDIDIFFLLNMTSMLLSMAVAMICFFFSCLFNDSAKALGFGAGIPIASLLLYMIGGSGENAKIFKELSIYNLLDAVGIVNGESVAIEIAVFIAMVVVLFGVSIFVFNKKRLPI